MTTVNQLNKIYQSDKFKELTSTELARYSGFLAAEEQIGRENLNNHFRLNEYLLTSANYPLLAEQSADFAEASRKFAIVSKLNREYEIRYNAVFYATYGVYPSQQVRVGA